MQDLPPAEVTKYGQKVAASAPALLEAVYGPLQGLIRVDIIARRTESVAWNASILSRAVVMGFRRRNAIASPDNKRSAGQQLQLRRIVGEIPDWSGSCCIFRAYAVMTR